MGDTTSGHCRRHSIAPMNWSRLARSPRGAASPRSGSVLGSGRKVEVADGQEKFVAPNGVSLAKDCVHLGHTWSRNVVVTDGEVVAGALL